MLQGATSNNTSVTSPLLVTTMSVLTFCCLSGFCVVHREMEAEPAGAQGSQDDVLKILVATDNHVGHLERDDVRRDDSFIAFEEICRIAAEREVGSLHCLCVLLPLQ